MEEIFKSGNVKALKDLISKYLTPKKKEAFLNAMEQNGNVSFVYSLNNRKTPNEFPKNTSQYDDEQYRQNEELYKSCLLSICQNTGQQDLTRILRSSLFHNPNSVYKIEVANSTMTRVRINYISRTNGNWKPVDTEMLAPFEVLK